MIRRVIAILLNFWVILAIFLLSGVLLVASYSLLRPVPDGQVARPPATAALTIIPAPTPTLPGTTPTPANSPTATPELSPTPPEGILAPGAYVQILGTGGDGLRLRTGAGLDFDVRYLGLEAEVFQVRDGPKQVDDYTWWHLVAPYDESRNGWAVSEYLSVIQNP